MVSKLLQEELHILRSIWAPESSQIIELPFHSEVEVYVCVRMRDYVCICRCVGYVCDLVQEIISRGLCLAFQSFTVNAIN